MNINDMPFFSNGNVVNNGGNGNVGVTVQSDFSQNDPTQPDYVKNRPFYEDGVFIELPLDISDCPVVGTQELTGMDGISFTFVKVSDNYFATAEEIYGALIKLHNAGSNLDFTIKEDDIVDLGNGFGVLVVQKGFYPLMLSVSSVGTSVIPSKDMIDEDMVLNISETGVYFLYVEGMAWVESFNNGSIKHIDEKFIPQNIKLPTYTSEDEGKVLKIVDGTPTWVSE